MISYANGIWLPSNDMAFPVIGDAVGSIRGFRIFTACKTVNGRLFLLDDHIQRLWSSAKALGMQLPHEPEVLKQILGDTLEKNKGESGELLLEIFYTGGPASGNGTSPVGPALLYILVLPLRLPADEWYQKGIAVAAYPHQRFMPEIKLTFYVGALLAHGSVVTAHNADLPLFVTEGANPYILEGSTFNLFVVKDGVLITPDTDGRILKGITRQCVIDLARQRGLTVLEQPVPLDYQWDEVFLVSSTRNIVPVNRVDHHVIGNGTPGAVTTFLMAQFAEMLAHY